jgi:hypothetical protein
MAASISTIAYFLVSLQGNTEAEALVYPKGELSIRNCAGELRPVAALPTMSAGYRSDWRVSFWDLKFYWSASAWDRARAKELFAYVEGVRLARETRGMEEPMVPPRKCEVS